MSYQFRSSMSSVIARHFREYRNFQTDILTAGAVMEIVAPPVVVAAICGAFTVSVSGAVAGSLIAATALTAAVLMCALLGITNMAMRWNESGPERGKSTSNRALFLEAIAATCAYGTLVGAGGAVAFTVAAVSSADLTRTIASVIGMALCAHLMMTVGMIMKRLVAVANATMIDVRTGG